jgi:xanthine/uracil permease
VRRRDNIDDRYYGVTFTAAGGLLPDNKQVQRMIDKITAGTIVAGVVGVLFGAIFDAAFLRPLQDSVFL